MESNGMRAKGQSLTEYGVLGALVLVVLIPALMLLSGSFNNNIRSSQVEKAKDIVPGIMNNRVPVPKVSAITSGALPETENLGDTVLSPDLQNLYIPKSGEELGKTIQTSGANGTTEMLMASLESQIQDLKDSGTLTPAQENALSQLAAQGHRLADMEAVLEQASKNYKGGDLDNSSVQFEGRNYTFGELRGQLGWKGSYALSVGLLTEPGASPETQKFIQLYQAAVKSGALKDQSALSKVEALSSEIAFITEVTDDATWAVTDGSGQPKNINSELVRIAGDGGELIYSTGSSWTNNDSEEICGVGNSAGKSGNCKKKNNALMP